jgi:hypothetical protein
LRLAVAWWLIGSAALLMRRAFPRAAEDGGETAAALKGKPDA